MTIDSCHNQQRRKRAATSTKPLPRRKIFPFTSLPPELRNKIYELTLASPDPIFLVSRFKSYRHSIFRKPMDREDESGSQRRSRYWRFNHTQAGQNSEDDDQVLPCLVPALLRLNKSIRSEANPILYSSNTFTLEDTTALHTFLSSIGTSNIALLTSLTINGWGYTKAHKAMNFPALSLLAHATALKKGGLYLNCRVGWLGLKGTAKQLLRDGHVWLDARGEKALDALGIDEENLLGYGHRRVAGDVEDLRGEVRRLMRKR